MQFRAELAAVAPADRDAWLDARLGLGDLPDDGADLPRDCVPYLPCSVDRLLRVIERAAVGPSDVFVDVGSGVGRAAAFVHLATGARAIGIEIQPALVAASRGLRDAMSTIEADASRAGTELPLGTVYFLYCPFSGARLSRFLDNLEPIARAQPLRICCLDMSLPERPWLEPVPQVDADLTIYRTL
ncbi:MAG TPA: hypothetical protein VMZ53_19360 [Kofleriaceae bacterium]|nr:hypothetical protein [Kofleriaceae bacterium]